MFLSSIFGRSAGNKGLDSTEAFDRLKNWDARDNRSVKEVVVGDARGNFSKIYAQVDDKTGVARKYLIEDEKHKGGFKVVDARDIQEHLSRQGLEMIPDGSTQKYLRPWQPGSADTLGKLSQTKPSTKPEAAKSPAAEVKVTEAKDPALLQWEKDKAEDWKQPVTTRPYIRAEPVRSTLEDGKVYPLRRTEKYLEDMKAQGNNITTIKGQDGDPALIVATDKEGKIVSAADPTVSESGRTSEIFYGDRLKTKLEDLGTSVEAIEAKAPKSSTGPVLTPTTPVPATMAPVSP